jgi:ATP-dependent Lon protease
MAPTFPVLPLRDIVVFPHMIVPLFVGRDKSVAALESAMAADKSIFSFRSSIRPRTIPTVKRCTTSASLPPFSSC